MSLKRTKSCGICATMMNSFKISLCNDCAGIKFKDNMDDKIDFVCDEMKILDPIQRVFLKTLCQKTCDHDDMCLEGFDGEYYSFCVSLLSEIAPLFKCVSITNLPDTTNSQTIYKLYKILNCSSYVLNSKCCNDRASKSKGSTDIICNKCNKVCDVEIKSTDNDDDDDISKQDSSEEDSEYNDKISEDDDNSDQEEPTKKIKV